MQETKHEHSFGLLYPQANREGEPTTVAIYCRVAGCAMTWVLANPALTASAALPAGEELRTLLDEAQVMAKNLIAGGYNHDCTCGHCAEIRRVLAKLDESTNLSRPAQVEGA